MNLLNSLIKKNYVKRIIILFLSVLLFSCSGMPANHSSSQSWLIRQNKFRNSKPTLTLLAVQVDVTNSRDSIERETAALAPLYFWNQGCRIIPSSEKPDYAAKIYVRERDINRGWRVKKSLAVEVHIWEFEDAPGFTSPVYEHKLPAAVGRVIYIGERTFSSSKITSEMLSKTIEISAKKLAVHKRQKKNA